MFVFMDIYGVSQLSVSLPWSIRKRLVWPPQTLQGNVHHFLVDLLERDALGRSRRTFAAALYKRKSQAEWVVEPGKITSGSVEFYCKMAQPGSIGHWTLKKD